MKMNKRTFLTLAASAVLVGPARAAEVEVHMMNKREDGKTMVFEPHFVKIQPGDTVKFLPTDKGHNAEIIKDFLPEGAEGFKGPMNQEVSVTFTQPGVYGVKCLPHFGMGMVALVIVGDGATAPNLEAAKKIKMPPGAKKEFDKIWADAGL